MHTLSLCHPGVILLAIKLAMAMIRRRAKKLADQICEAKGLNQADVVYVECPDT